MSAAPVITLAEMRRRKPDPERALALHFGL